MSFDDFLSRLSAEQREEALRAQRKLKSEDIDKVLLQLRATAEPSELASKAQDLQVGFINLERVRIEGSAISSIPKNLADFFAIVPVKREGNMLYLATANPTDGEMLAEVNRQTGLRIIPVLAELGRIKEKIGQYYCEIY